MFSLLTKTPKSWLDVVFKDFDTFLLDHAACERKAAAMGISFVVQYPDRTALIDPMIHFAREELEHFQQVCRVVVKRGLQLSDDTKDAYVNLLHKQVRTTREGRLLDRLLVASVVEARGFERLALITDHLADPELKSLYRRLTHCEGRHQGLFVELAQFYFPMDQIRLRLKHFLEVEAHAIDSVPFRPAVH